MSISSTEYIKRYVGDGALKIFSFPYYASAAGDIKVDIDDVVQSSGYTNTQTVFGDNSAWTVTFVTEPALNEKISIYRDTTNTQDSDYVTNDPIPDDVIEDDFDKRTAVSQEIEGEQARAIKLPRSDTPDDDNTVLPNATTRASKLLGFDASGDLDMVTVTSGSPSNAAAITYTPAGASAVDTTVQAALRRHNYPEDSGATADGATDDYTEIQTAITDTPSGGVLTFTPGKTYVCGTTLVVSNPITIIGYGATLDVSGIAAAAGIDFQTSNWKVLGLKITGPGNTSYASGSFGISCTGTNNSPSAPTYYTDYNVEDCTITEFGDAGLYFRYGQRVKVLNNTITEIGYSGIGSWAMKEFWYDNNHIEGISPGTSGNSYQIIASRFMAAAYSETAEPRCTRGKITNNILLDNALWEAIDSKGSEQMLIDRNHIEGCKIGMTLSASQDGTGSGAEDLSFRDSIVSNNVMIGGNDGVGINLIGAFNAATSAVVQYGTNNRIVNNYLYDFGIDNNNNNGAIKIEGQQNCVIDGNTIDQALYACVILGIFNDGVQITNNNLKDPYDSTKTDTSCINIDQRTNLNISISGNKFVYKNTGLTNPATYSLLAIAELTGTHDGATSATILDDSGASFSVDQLIGGVARNTSGTYNAWGRITDNDGTTVTVDDLYDGDDGNWVSGDTYAVNGISVEVGNNDFDGNDASHLTFGNMLQGGIIINGAMAQNGTHVITTDTGANEVLRSVTFKKPFPLTPRVFCSIINDQTPGGDLSLVNPTAVTTTGFTIRLNTADGAVFASAEDELVAWEAETISEE